MAEQEIIPPEKNTSQNYGQPGPRPNDPSGMSVASMVLGIVGVIGMIITCVPYIGWLLLIPFTIVDLLAIVFGAVELNRIKTGMISRIPNKGMALAGILCGIFPIVAWIVGIILMILGVGGIAVLDAMSQ